MGNFGSLGCRDGRCATVQAWYHPLWYYAAWQSGKLAHTVMPTIGERALCNMAQLDLRMLVADASTDRHARIDESRLVFSGFD